MFWPQFLPYELHEKASGLQFLIMTLAFRHYCPFLIPFLIRLHQLLVTFYFSSCLLGSCSKLLISALLSFHLVFPWSNLTQSPGCCHMSRLMNSRLFSDCHTHIPRTWLQGMWPAQWACLGGSFLEIECSVVTILKFKTLFLNFEFVFCKSTSLLVLP